MTSDPPESNHRPEMPRELPPVEPPSAAFIIQLFVIPAVIVLVLVVAYLAFVQLPFGRLANGGRDVMDYVRSMKSNNEHRKWRSAKDLANLINNDARLAKDSRLLGELTALLEDELRHPKKNEPELPQFLSLALGTFQTLKANPVDGRQVDPVLTLCHALEKNQEVAVRVSAAISLSRLADRFGGDLGNTEAQNALIANVSDDDKEVRQRVAYALGYFPGEKSIAALDTRTQTDTVPEVRYNAAVALARLGSPSAKNTLREMLSAADLAQTVKRESPSETQTAIQAIQLEALWGLEASPPGASSSKLLVAVRPEVESLTKSASKEVQMEALNLLKKIPKPD